MCMYDDSERPTFYREQVRKARKVHKCMECGREIAPREHYQYVTAKWDGQLDSIKTCSHCQVLQAWLVAECAGYVHHAIVDDVQEHLEECGVSAYGFGLARLVVLARNGWKRRGALVSIPSVPRTTHERMAA